MHLKTQIAWKEGIGRGGGELQALSWLHIYNEKRPAYELLQTCKLSWKVNNYSTVLTQCCSYGSQNAFLSLQQA